MASQKSKIGIEENKDFAIDFQCRQIYTKCMDSYFPVVVSCKIRSAKQCFVYFSSFLASF